MKKLINLGLSGLLLLSMTSCSKYYMSSLSSTNAVKDEKTGEFNIENDTLKVTYSFAGEDAPVKIKIKNKLSVPVNVDWSKSSLIFKENATSFIPDKIAFAGNVSSSSWRNSDITTTDGRISGQISKPSEISFIPPNASIEKTTIFYQVGAFKNLSDTVFKSREALDGSNGAVKIYSANFTRENSPIVFRSYITFYTGTEKQTQFFSLDNEFYVSRSIRSSLEPESLLAYTTKLSEFFYSKTSLSDDTATGKTTVIGIVPNNPAATTNK